MAVTAWLFAQAPQRAYTGSVIGLGSAAGTVCCCLVAAAGSVEKHQYDWASYSDITNEATGTGYTAGGTALANKFLGSGATAPVTKFDADDTWWGTSTITAKYAVVYSRAPGSQLLVGVDFGTNIVSSNGSFTITWGANGIFTDTVGGTA